MDILIFGAGLIGVTLAKHLSEQAHNVTIIDSNLELIQKIHEKMDVRGLHGDFSDDAIFKQAGLNTADLVLAVTDSDETNIVLTLITHGENDKARVFARIRGDHYTDKAGLWRGDRFNNTMIFNPERAVIDSILELLSIPCAFEVIPIAEHFIKLAGFRVGAASPLVGRPLQALALADHDHFLIVAAEQNGKVVIPSGETVLASGDRVYVTWTKATKLKKMRDLLALQPPDGDHVVIIGGGRIGSGVAQALLKADETKVTMIEKVLERCHLLADRFSKATVIHGDATDQDFLKEIVRNATTLIAATGTQELNFLLALMADRLGVHRVIPVLDNEAYISLAPSHGIDAVVSNNLATVGEILGHLRKGQVLDSSPMLDGRLHAFLVKIQEYSRLAEAPLAEIGIPKDILIAAVMRDEEIMIPNGKSQLLLDDQAIILCATRQIRHMDELLSLVP